MIPNPTISSEWRANLDVPVAIIEETHTVFCPRPRLYSIIAMKTLFITAVVAACASSRVLAQGRANARCRPLPLSSRQRSYLL
jgi:hypothetical protein